MAEKTIKAAVLGAAGRMGMRIIDCIAHAKGDSIGWRGWTARPSFPRAKCWGLYGDKRFKNHFAGWREKNFARIDVVIDFTEIKSSLFNAEAVASEKKALVIGTTGFSIPETEALKQKLSGGPLCIIPQYEHWGECNVQNRKFNCPDLKRWLWYWNRGGTPSDEEGCSERNCSPPWQHHRWSFWSSIGIQVGIFGRKGVLGERKTQEIGVHAVRAGILWVIILSFLLDLASGFEIIHRAHSRILCQRCGEGGALGGWSGSREFIVWKMCLVFHTWYFENKLDTRSHERGKSFRTGQKYSGYSQWRLRWFYRNITGN